MPDLVAPSSIDMILSNKAVDRSSLELSTDTGEIANSSQSARDSESDCSIDIASKSSSDSYCEVKIVAKTILLLTSPVKPDDGPVTPVELVMLIPALVTPS